MNNMVDLFQEKFYTLPDKVQIIPKKIYVMGVDPAWSKPIAWAVSDGEKIWKYGKWVSGKDIMPEDICFPCEYVYIEGQHKQNMRVMQLLAMATGEIIMCAKMSKVPWKIVEPREWIRSYKLHERMGGKALKPAYLNLARALTGEEIKDIDIACACLIAAYGARRERYIQQEASLEN